MQYRREIDGLRAIAVLPVILFHAGFSWFSGGYVGVDVFFVISGYLITSILISELDKGTFSIGNFYERRARRILPALFFVLLCCIPFGWFWSTPPQFKNFSESLVAVSLFASNIYFWRKEGYFAPAAEENPLLHTWSLAVEEQFYIFFPILLLILWRFGRSPVFYIVIGFSLISLALAEYGWRHHATANFYLLPTRAWELGVGAICAFVLHNRAVKSGQFFSAIGLALILYSIVGFDESVPFPSLYSLIPVVGAALIIVYGGHDTYTARMLSSRVLVGIGLISFSAYLWHQPLFAFARIRNLFELSFPMLVSLCVASFGLAYLTWRYVEQPFRRRQTSVLKARSKIFLAASSASLAFLAFGAYGYVSGGLKDANPMPEALHKDLYTRELQEECFGSAGNRVEEGGLFCIVGGVSKKPSVAVLGDSHSLSFLAPLAREFEKKGGSFIYSGISGCPPLIDTYVLRYDQSRAACNRRNTEIFKKVVDSEIKKVFLISRWTYYSTGDKTGAFVYINKSYDVPKDRSHSFDVFRERLSATLQFFELNGVEVFVLHQAPLQEIDARRLYTWAHIFNEDIDRVMIEASLDKSVHQRRYERVKRAIDSKVSLFEHAHAIDFTERLCPESKCWIGNADRSYYFDDDHLSNYGAEWVLEGLLDRVILQQPAAFVNR